MNLDLTFSLSNFMVLPFWGLMILAPHWRWTKRVLGSLWPVLIPSVIYTLMLLPQVVNVSGELLNPDLDGIAGLLGTQQGALIGWVHFLAFDLFVGRWVYLDSRTHQVSAWLASPALFLVLMAGPLGLLAYLGLRSLWLARSPAQGERV